VRECVKPDHRTSGAVQHQYQRLRDFTCVSVRAYKCWWKREGQVEKRVHLPFSHELHPKLAVASQDVDSAEDVAFTTAQVPSASAAAPNHLLIGGNYPVL